MYIEDQFVDALEIVHLELPERLVLGDVAVSRLAVVVDVAEAMGCAV